MGLHQGKRVGTLTKHNNGVGDCSLCWDCANATLPHKCPWVGDGTPIDGWWARKTKLKFKGGDGSGGSYVRMVDSYNVIVCPLFERDAWRGGQFKHDTDKKTNLKDATESDLRAICAAIIQRFVLDWETLGRGKEKKFITYGNKVVKAETVREFFQSEWFEMLLSVVSDFDPDHVREILGVPCKEKTKSRRR